MRMKQILIIIALVLPFTLKAETWDLPMGGLTENGKISVTDKAMSISWDDYYGDHIDFTFNKGKSYYLKVSESSYTFCSAEHGSNGNILFMYDDGILRIIDVADKSSNGNGKELMKVGVDSTVFNKCFKLAVSKGIFKQI